MRFETINKLIDKGKKDLQNSFNDKKEIPNLSEIFTTGNINPNDNQSTLYVEAKEKFDVKTNEIIK